MKTTTLFQQVCAAGIAFCSFGGPAQAQPFDVGTNVVTAGIGLGGTRYSYINSYSDRYKISPTLCASFERGVTELGPGVLGLGGFFARKSVKYEYVDNSSWNTYIYNHDEQFSNTVIGLRGAWHYNEWHGSDRFDLYGGIMLGYNIGSYKNNSTRTRRSTGISEPWNSSYNYSLSFVTWSTYLGARYYFSESVGAYLELGYGIAYANLGVALKF